MSDRARKPSVLREILDGGAAGGLLLMASAVLALFVANSSLADGYFEALHAHFGGLSLLHWINDGLMAIFFLFVGLEIKREFLDGQLSTWSNRALPCIAAAGGVIVPGLIYAAVNAGNPETLRGWAIPTATDIAFALGVLSLLGPRVPTSLKVFLATLAIVDDLAAVLVIAVFYTAKVNVVALCGAGVVCLLLVGLNRLSVVRLAPYLMLGLALWWLVLLSGIHATVAGVVLAMTIPIGASKGAPDDAASPLHRLEHGLSPWVSFLVVPIFGFANAGVSFAGMRPSALFEPVTLGVALALFLGKQAGVFSAAWLAIRLRIACLPMAASWSQLYGVSLLCGIGFTMSLFIGLLAFPSPGLQDEVKVGVLVGSLVSTLGGVLVLRLAKRRDPTPLASDRQKGDPPSLGECLVPGGASTSGHGATMPAKQGIRPNVLYDAGASPGFGANGGLGRDRQLRQRRHRRSVPAGPRPDPVGADGVCGADRFHAIEKRPRHRSSGQGCAL